MTDAEMLAKATRFDAGYPITLNGKYMTPELCEYYTDVKDGSHNYTIEYRGTTGWCISDGFRCLSKSGKWRSERTPTNRTDHFKKWCRFPTAREAFDFLEKYREECRQKAERKLKKNPKAIIEF
jgi:hypothetical protein